MNSRWTRRRFLATSGASALLAARGGVLGQDARPPPIRIGQIGTAHAHAAGKVASYRRSASFELVGVVEDDPARRADAARLPAYRDVRWMTRDELFGTPGLRAVAIETRIEDLLDEAEAAVDAGFHIHLDKPAGSSLPQFRRILASATRQKLVVQMGYMYRYNPAIVLLRDLLRRGWLGEPFEVHAVMSKVVAPGDRDELARFPGGILFELGCHVVDLTIGLLGAPEKVTGFARHSSPRDDGLLDNMLAVLEYPRAIATVKSSAQEVEGFARRHLVVCGTEGTLHIQPLDSPSARLALARERGAYRAGYQEITFPEYERYVDDAEDLARVIRGEKASDFPSAHDLAVQTALLEACGLPTG